jgi:hypothetical protein
MSSSTPSPASPQVAELPKASVVEDKDAGKVMTPSKYEVVHDASPSLQTGLEAAEWEATIRKVVSAVVSVQYCRPFAFDNVPSGKAQATGFVVDADRGYVQSPP